MVDEKKCIYCGGEVKPVEDFFKQNSQYEEMKKEFKQITGFDWQESQDYNCVSCGIVYDGLLRPKGYKIAWLQAQVANAGVRE